MREAYDKSVDYIDSRDATFDHQEVRDWVESHGASPARLRGSAGGEDLGLLDLDFSEGRDDRLERISWFSWFHAFEADRMALVIPPEEDGPSLPGSVELVSR